MLQKWIILLLFANCCDLMCVKGGKDYWLLIKEEIGVGGWWEVNDFD